MYMYIYIYIHIEIGYHYGYLGGLGPYIFNPEDVQVQRRQLFVGLQLLGGLGASKVLGFRCLGLRV